MGPMGPMVPFDVRHATSGGRSGGLCEVRRDAPGQQGGDGARGLISSPKPWKASIDETRSVNVYVYMVCHILASI